MVIWVWNLLLKMYIWFWLWKRVNIIFLLKVEVLKEKSDYCGINVILVMFRVFEKVVFNVYVCDVVEENLIVL